MNDVPKGHYWFWYSRNDTVSNFPPISTGSNKRCFIDITNSENGYQYQKVVNVFNGNPLETFERFKGGSSYEWSTWVRTDNYGTSSLSELASALGVWQGGLCSNAVGLTPEFGYCGVNTPNKPDGCTGGFKIGLYNSSQGVGYIIFFGYKNNAFSMYFGQTDSNGNVGTWYKVSSTAL